MITSFFGAAIIGKSPGSQHLASSTRALLITGETASGDLDGALAAWLDQKAGAGMTYRQIHDELEAMALRHLLTRYGGKPTVLAWELQMNRVTLRRRRQSILREESTEEA